MIIKIRKIHNMTWKLVLKLILLFLIYKKFIGKYLSNLL